MNQSDLFIDADAERKAILTRHKDAGTRYRHSDPITSEEAARSIVGSMRDNQLHVLRTFWNCREMTDTDLLEEYERQSRPRQSPSGLRTRRSELAELGVIVDSGKKKRLPSGRLGIIWTLHPTLLESYEHGRR